MIVLRNKMRKENEGSQKQATAFESRSADAFEFSPARAVGIVL
jgi:hypothetical protein